LKDSLTITSRAGSFTEKAPVVSTANLSPDSAFPQTGFMASSFKMNGLMSEGGSSL
jgi:hypothetical protein